MRATAERLRRWCAAEGASALRELRDQARTEGGVSFALAALLAGRGHADEVYAVLDNAAFDHLFAPEGHLPLSDLGLNMLFSPFARGLRRDRRFARLAVNLGLGAFWEASGEWPDCVAEVAPWYDLEAEVRLWLQRTGISTRRYDQAGATAASAAARAAG